MNSIRVELEFAGSRETNVFIARPYREISKLTHQQFVEWIVNQFEDYMTDRQFRLLLHDGTDTIEQSFYPFPNTSDRAMREELGWIASKIVREYRS